MAQQRPINCDECDEIFENRRDYRDHKAEIHLQNACNLCDVVYRCRSSLIRHKQTVHRLRTTAKNTVICGECGIGLHSIAELCEHLNADHDLDIKVESYEFKNASLYENWRKEVEKSGRFEFSCSNGARKFDTFTKEYFYCQLSAMYNNSATKKYKFPPIGNVGDRPKYHCCAFAIVCNRIETGEVQVRACLQHYGFESHLGRIRLSDESRLKIMDMLREGETCEDILQHCRDEEQTKEAVKSVESSSNDDQKPNETDVVTRQDILNIQKLMNLKIIPTGPFKRASPTLVVEENEKQQSLRDIIEEKSLSTSPLPPKMPKAHGTRGRAPPPMVHASESQKLLKQVCKEILTQTINDDTMAAQALEKALELQRIYNTAADSGVVSVDRRYADGRTRQQIENYLANKSASKREPSPPEPAFRRPIIKQDSDRQYIVHNYSLLAKESSATENRKTFINRVSLDKVDRAPVLDPQPPRSSPITNRTPEPLMNYLTDLHVNRNFTDVIVVCEGNTVGSYHRAILSAFSSHFENALMDFESNSQLALEIDPEATGVVVEDLRILLDFMYTGRAMSTPTLKQSAKTLGVVTLTNIDMKQNGTIVEVKDHARTLLTQLSRYYKMGGKFTDVAVHCRGTLVNYCHRIVLAAYSDHFNAALANMNHCAYVTLEIDSDVTGVSPMDLCAIIDFMYYGVECLSSRRLRSLRSVAEALGVTQLLEIFDSDDFGTNYFPTEKVVKTSPTKNAAAVVEHNGSVEGFDEEMDDYEFEETVATSLDVADDVSNEMMADEDEAAREDSPTIPLPPLTSLKKPTKPKNNKYYVCPMEGCEKGFLSRTNYLAHIRGHNDEKPYVCEWETCAKSFKRSDELFRHRRSHTGDRPYDCQVCDKKFARPDHLAKHKRSHIHKCAVAAAVEDSLFKKPSPPPRRTL